MENTKVVSYNECVWERDCVGTSKDSSILKLELRTFYGEILNKVAEERKEEKE